jgi:hypothetical protein
MKKFTFVFIVCLFSFSLFGQQVDRNYVVVEIGTGTWCTYCPGAAMGADDLVENGHKVAIIENHNGDSYAYSGSNARNTYYGISGYPTAFFDGGNSVVGGSHTQSMYPSYLPKYNNAIAVLSDFTMELSATHDALDYDVTIDINEVGNYTGTNLVVHLVLTESHIEESWQGMSELNFVSRAMYPTQTGTAYTGGATTLNLSFTANAGWDLSNCELVAFIQDNTNKNILQSDKISLAEPTGLNNVALNEISEIPDLCEGSISPILKIKNLGATDVTSLSIDYDVNNGASTGTLSWTGSAVPFNQFASIELDEITFTLLSNNNAEFEITQVNGVDDEDPSNNTTSTSFSQAPTGSTIVYMELHTDNYGSECTWDVRNSSGTVLYAGGPYGNNQTILKTFYLNLDCNTFNLYDSYGDGGGAVTLEDSEGNVLFYTNGSYGSGASQRMNTSITVLPEVSFNPDNLATGIDALQNIVITFNQPMRNSDNSLITNDNISSFIILTDPNKGNIDYNGSINSEKTVITIDPVDVLPESTEITISITGDLIETYFDDLLSESTSTFTTDIYPQANVVFNPANNAPNVPVATNITLTFDDAMRRFDNSEITGSNISEFVSITDSQSNNYTFTATINSAKTIITINPTENFPGSTYITVTIQADAVENLYNMALGESSSSFTTITVVGMEDIENRVSVFPNPSNGLLNINNAENSALTIYDLTGRIVLEKLIEDQNESLTVSQLVPGNYIVIINHNGVITEKRISIIK